MSGASELDRLQTFSLSIAAPHRSPLILRDTDLPRIPPAPSLTALHLTLSGGRCQLPDGFLAHFASQIALSRLTSLALLNLLVTPSQLASALRTCLQLTELFISSVSPAILSTPELENTRLTVIHLTAAERSPPKLEALVALAERVKTLEQVGVGNRVYEVFRGRGVVELARWGRTDIPRYFQVWRG